jgi:hypothetical protein
MAAHLFLNILILDVPEGYRDDMANVVEGIIDEVSSFRAIRIDGLMPDFGIAGVHIGLSPAEALLKVHRSFHFNKSGNFPDNTAEKLPFR